MSQRKGELEFLVMSYLATNYQGHGWRQCSCSRILSALNDDCATHQKTARGSVYRILEKLEHNGHMEVIPDPQAHVYADRVTQFARLTSKGIEEFEKQANTILQKQQYLTKWAESGLSGLCDDDKKSKKIN